MTDTTITGLSFGSTPTGTEVVPVDQGSGPTTVKLTINQILALITLSGLGGTTAAAALAAAEAAITLGSLGCDQEYIGEQLYPQTAAEISASITPTNYSYPPGYPERYGAIGNGSANDQTAVANCFAANQYVYLTNDYLITGITISTQGLVVSGVGPNARLLISSAANSFGLHFVSSSGNSTHFYSDAVLVNFGISCQAGANHTYGVWMDNAELLYARGFSISLANNTYAGTPGVLLGNSGAPSYAMEGVFTQDGTFTQCTFVGGSGTGGDGLYLCDLGSLSLSNSNVFVSCRFQSSGGYGCRIRWGDGNCFYSCTFQANAGGGYIDADDSSNGSVGNIIHNGYFEGNSGDDIHATVTSDLQILLCQFHGTTQTNHINLLYAINCQIVGNVAFSSSPVLIGSSGGTGNYFDRRQNLGACTFAAGTMADVAPVTLTYGSTIAVNASSANDFSITVTNGSNFTISSPTNGSYGQEIVFYITNSSGGSMGTVTWGAGFTLNSSGFTDPGNGHTSLIRFRYNGSWYQSAPQVNY